MSFIRRSSAARAEAGRGPLTRKSALSALAGLSLLAVAGCGFHPLYGKHSEAAPAELAQVEIQLIPDRTGQMLRNALLQRFHPRGGTGTRYALDVGVRETLQDLGIQKNTVATRANLTLTARYTVTSLATGKPLMSNVASSINSYDILTQDFATLSARADARKRGVRELANQIEEQVALWLLQTGGKAVPGISPKAAMPKSNVTGTTRTSVMPGRAGPGYGYGSFGTPPYENGSGAQTP